MKKTAIKLTKEFKSQTTTAIISVAFFLLTYLFILVLAIGLTPLCVYGGFMLIAIKPMLVTIAFGIGLASLGFLILIFLLKFTFKSHKIDRTHLLEIKKADEPELFNLIDEIVKEVETSFPKKVYLSTDVNACVFYDSSFWSMFLPIRKNLQIGIGLVNTVSKIELKAILSHEFGHFSQRTMKVGSFVYNVNQVIFNMLYDNESYNELIKRWANMSGYFSIFVVIAVKIIGGIQWILRKLYDIVNKSYLGLSREMEFHADEIAASITGYEPLKSSLLRMSLADNSFNSVLNFYNGKITDNVKCENIYRDQTAVMKFLAERNNFKIKNELPEISFEEQSKFDKSKLVVKDQWASHPGTKERVKRLEKLNSGPENVSDTPANNIFKNIDETQRLLTNKIYEAIDYPGGTETMSLDDFQTEYFGEYLKNSFSKIYNGYYDNKNPILIEFNNFEPKENSISFHELFSDAKVDLVYTGIALHSDIETLKNISNGTYDIKTFDYDGVKYKRKDSEELFQRLERELEQTNEQIKRNDIQIFEFFRRLEIEQTKSTELNFLYSEFFEFDKIFDSKFEVYSRLTNDLQFVNITTPFEQIKENLAKAKPHEEQLKSEIKYMLSDNRFSTEITTQIKESFGLYLSKDWEYFSGTEYFNENLSTLYAAMNNYAYLLSRGYFLLKNRLLTYQEELMKSHTQLPIGKSDACHQNSETAQIVMNV